MKRNNWIYTSLIIVVISFLTIGYAAFTNNLNINDLLAHFRAEADIRITGVGVESVAGDAITYSEDYGVDAIISEVSLPSNDSSVTYKIEVTNFGGTYMVISQINGLPDNLTYTLDNYDLNDIICDENNECTLGITKYIYLTIKHKNEITEEDITIYNLDLDVVFEEFSYTIKYYDLFLPSEYQEVEYIESTGTQRINTKYIPKTNTKIELDLSFSGTFDISSGSVGTGTIFYSASSGNSFSVNFGDGASQGNNLFTWFDKNLANGGTVHYYDISDTVRTNKNTLTYEKGVFKYGTLNAKNVAVKTEDNTNPLYLFGSSGKNFDRYNMKVYRLKFYEDGVLKRDYIPCYRKSDGVIGLYELLTGTFYTNIGTGVFNKGNDVTTNSQVMSAYSSIQTIKYGEVSNIKDIVIAREDYIFTGWSTEEVGTIAYDAGQEVLNLTNINGTQFELYAQWRNYVGWNLYDVIKENAVPDNGPSRFVKSDTGIDFLEIASDENGKGVYIISDTLDDDNPIYYYRGAVDNNNIVFAGFCWKMLRTTDTGGIKLVYNGVPVNGSCNNTGWDSQIANGIYFNPTSVSIAGAGYSYTETLDLVMNSKKDTEVAAGTIFAYNIDYNDVTGKYTLIGDKVTTTSNLTAEKYDQIKEHHFTCFKTVDEECDTVSYVYMARNNYLYYAILRNGMDEIGDILHIDFEGGSANGKPSTLQTTINNWYKGNMLNYSQYLEDTIYCNDRSIYNPWNLTSSIENDDTLKLQFATKARIAFTGDVTLDCKYKSDSFTVSLKNGNGVLDYPVATISYDEASFAGLPWWKSDSDNFLANGKVWWTMSPGFISTTGIYNGIVSSQLDHVAVNWRGTKTTIDSIVYYSGGGVRPIVSLKSGAIVQNGFGTADAPFMIEEIEYVPVSDIYDPNNTNEEMLHIGDFVNYDAGKWTQSEIDSIKVGPVSAPVSVNNSFDLPTSDYQFGGFTFRSSRNDTSQIAQFNGLGTVGYINDASTGEPISGWRVYDIDETTGEVTLISAGNPEAFYQTAASDAGYSTPYIFDGTIHSSWGEENAANYLKRDWTPYVNEAQGATSAYILSKDDLEAWYSKHIGVTGDLWTQANFRQIYSYSRLHNIIDNYSFWWLASTRSYQGPHFVQGDDDRRLRGGNSVVLGIRVNVVLSNLAQFSSERVGTIELTSEHFDGYGGNQFYNVWDLKRINTE